MTIDYAARRDQILAEIAAIDASMLKVLSNSYETWVHDGDTYQQKDPDMLRRQRQGLYAELAQIDDILGGSVGQQFRKVRFEEASLE